MKEAIELLKQEEFYLCEKKCSVWKAYGVEETIHTKTMKVLQKRGIVEIKIPISGNAFKMAVLKRSESMENEIRAIDFFLKAHKICDENIRRCQDCPLTEYCINGIFAKNKKSFNSMIKKVKDYNLGGKWYE